MARSSSGPVDDWPLDEDALGTEFVTVLVGHKKKETSFHKKLLSSRSTAFDNHMKALKDKGRYQYHCESRFENAFTILVTYLYKGYVPSGPLEDGPVVSTYGRQMRELYYLAERFEINDLMDKTLDAIQSHDHRHSRDMCKYIGEIYMNTARDSKLRLYASVSVAWNLGRLSPTNEAKLNLIETFRDRAEILSDILKALVMFQTSIADPSINYRNPSAVDGLGPCHFHAHGADVTCHKENVLEAAKKDTQHVVKAETAGTGAMRDESIGVSHLDDDNDLVILTREEVEEMARKKVREGKRPAKDKGAGAATVDHIPGIQEAFIPKSQEPSGISESAPASRADLPVKLNDQRNAKGFPKRNAEEDLRCSSKRPRPCVVIGGPPEFKGSIGNSESIGKGPATAKPPPTQEFKKLPEGTGNHFQPSQSQTGPNVTNPFATSARLPSYKPEANESPIVSTGFVSGNKSHGNTTHTSVGIGKSPATAVNSLPVVPRPASGRGRGGQPQRARSFMSPHMRISGIKVEDPRKAIAY
ncbi:Amino acid transporter protein [Rutstroemia sp. NJR-2017a WRK4]|nr:Amino acid transporter protein [Rutstroemia sp. NJR-2017a WRK4]